MTTLPAVVLVKVDGVATADRGDGVVVETAGVAVTRIVHPVAEVGVSAGVGNYEQHLGAVRGVPEARHPIAAGRTRRQAVVLEDGGRDRVVVVDLVGGDQRGQGDAGVHEHLGGRAGAARTRNRHSGRVGVTG